MANIAIILDLLYSIYMPLTDQDILYLMIKSLLYKVRSNVRMITLQFRSDNLTKMKLFCYLDTAPVELDTELMDDAVALFLAYIDPYTLDIKMPDVEIVVECRLGPWEEIYDGRSILYARYEPPKENG